MESELGVRILEKLGYGKANAVTGKQLAQMFGYRDDRLIRQEIRDLIADGWRIASLTVPPYGYFLANTPEEVNEYIRATKSRLVQDALRLRDFRKANKVILNPHQLQMTGLGGMRQ